MDAGRGAIDPLIEIRTVAETGSTNADMLALAAAGAREGLWLRAERQTAGRGRQGRKWISTIGNLYASTVVRLQPTDPVAPSLALVAGVALAEVIATALSRDVETSEGGRVDALHLKWPNDLLLGGAKLSGILLERAGDTVVIGFGVNIVHHPDLPDRPTTSLTAHHVSLRAEVLIAALAAQFAARVTEWRDEGLAPIRERWLALAHPPGQSLTARLPDGTALDGAFDGLAADGAMLLRLADGSVRAIHAGDVFAL